MLLALALIPVVLLLIYIYFNDKNGKEPFGLLVGLFFAGVGTIIPAVIVELIGQAILSRTVPVDTVPGAIVFAMLVVAPAEELSKFLALRLITWKNRHFDYSYDAIVYSVFVSMGFAGLENIGYVFSNGLSVAILRMFTAVPGHACFAVFMGYFYSRAKRASLVNNKSAYRKELALTMLIPILMHGVYDAIIMAGSASREQSVALLCTLAWIACVVLLFVFSILTVRKSSKTSFCILNIPGMSQTVYVPNVVGPWTCTCGKVNNFNFCQQCGLSRPAIAPWYCPRCGALSIYGFCGNCGQGYTQSQPYVPQPQPYAPQPQPYAPQLQPYAPQPQPYAPQPQNPPYPQY